MKKLILILFILLFTSGCYDYQEVNDLAFISAIGIDYEKDKFQVTFEVLNTKKVGENQNSEETYTVSGSGDSLSEAFDDVAVKVSKIPYFYHLKAVVLSEDMAKYQMASFIDFTARSTEVRNEFYLGIAYECSAEEIIKSSSKTNPVIGNFISTITQSNTVRYNVSYSKPFEDVLERILNGKEDAVVTSFTLNDDVLEAKGLALFKDKKYITTFSGEDSALLNTLMANDANMNITKEYENDDFIINVYESKSEIKFQDDTAYINLMVEADVKENGPDFDLGKESIYQKLSKDFSKVIEVKAQDLVDSLIKYEVDPLGINDVYYKKSKKDVKNIYEKFKVKVKTEVTINKNGQIFEVAYE